jgi:hypothetical protein
MILNSRCARLSIYEVSCISRDLEYYYSVTSDNTCYSTYTFARVTPPAKCAFRVSLFLSRLRLETCRTAPHVRFGLGMPMACSRVAGSYFSRGGGWGELHVGDGMGHIRHRFWFLSNLILHIPSCSSCASYWWSSSSLQVCIYSFLIHIYMYIPPREEIP